MKSLNTLLILAGFGAVGCSLDAYADAARPLPARLLAAEGTAVDAAALYPAAMALSAAGGLAVIAASSGLAATSLRMPRLLSFSTVLLSVLLAAELCLAVAAFEGSATGSLDPSGFRPQLSQLLRRFRVFLGIAVGDQVLALVASCLLQSAYTSVDEAAEDIEDDLASTRPLLRDQEAGVGRSPLPGRAARLSSGGGAIPGPGSRTQSAAEAARQLQQLQGGGGRRGAAGSTQQARGCSIM